MKQFCFLKLYFTASYLFFLKQQSEVEDCQVAYLYIFLLIVVIAGIWIKNLIGATLAPLSIFLLIDIISQAPSPQY